MVAGVVLRTNEVKVALVLKDLGNVFPATATRASSYVYWYPWPASCSTQLGGKIVAQFTVFANVSKTEDSFPNEKGKMQLRKQAIERSSRNESLYFWYQTGDRFILVAATTAT
jgi:hypothetical protein